MHRLTINSHLLRLRMDPVKSHKALKICLNTLRLWQNLLRNRAHMHLSMSQQTSDSVHKFPIT